MLLSSLIVGILLLKTSSSSGVSIRSHLSRSKLTKNQPLVETYMQMKYKGKLRQIRSRSKRCPKGWYRNAGDGICYNCMICVFPDVPLSQCTPSSDTVCGFMSPGTKGRPTEEPLQPDFQVANHIGIHQTTVETILTQQLIDRGEINNEQSDQSLVRNRYKRKKRRCKSNNKKKHKTSQKCKRDGRSCRRKKHRCRNRKRKRKPSTSPSEVQTTCLDDHYYNDTIKQCYPCTKCVYPEKEATMCSQYRDTVCSPFQTPISSTQVSAFSQGHEILQIVQSPEANSTQNNNSELSTSVPTDSDSLNTRMSHSATSLRKHRDKRAGGKKWKNDNRAGGDEWKNDNGEWIQCTLCDPTVHVVVELCEPDKKKDTVCGPKPVTGSSTTEVSRITIRPKRPPDTKSITRNAQNPSNVLTGTHIEYSTLRDDREIAVTNSQSDSKTKNSNFVTETPQTKIPYHTIADENDVTASVVENTGLLKKSLQQDQIDYTVLGVVAVAAGFLIFLLAVILLGICFMRSKPASSLPPGGTASSVITPTTPPLHTGSMSNVDANMMSPHADTWSSFTSAYEYVSSSPYYPERRVGPSVSQTDLRPYTGPYVGIQKPQYYIFPKADIISVSQISNPCEV
ncbi:uncharacterized protein [Amphiura filiformis]|uniref:uncharacterized protein n=1 Tax=Amphiura filiformis TaxID=82378 RepID=UPI003B21645E